MLISYLQAGTNTMNKFNYGQLMLMKMLETPEIYAETLDTKSRNIFGKVKERNLH